MNFTIALAQIDSVIGDLEKNVSKHVEFVRRSSDGGADLVVFPELSLSGYTIRDSNWDVAIRLPDDKKFGELLNLSSKISIIVGGVEESQEFGIFNSAFLIEKGKVRSVHRKLYPPTYGMFEEMRYFSAGTSVRAFESKIGKLGVLICEDLWHLPLPYLLAKDNATTVIAIAASPTRLTGEKGNPAIAQINVEHHKAYARLLSSYFVFCNRVGFEDGVNFWGGSEVVNPHGDVIVQAKLFEEDLLFAEIREEEIRRARRLSRHFLDDDMRVIIEELQRIRAGQ
jgi:predicted amidohydrolase